MSLTEPAKLLLLTALLSKDRIISNNGKSFLKELILRRLKLHFTYFYSLFPMIMTVLNYFLLKDVCFILSIIEAVKYKIFYFEGILG